MSLFHKALGCLGRGEMAAASPAGDAKGARPGCVVCSSLSTAFVFLLR